jgi:hypothetical protein
MSANSMPCWPRPSAGRGTSASDPRSGRLVVDVDSTICEVHGHHKTGAAYGYTRCLGYHPLLATRADTGEVLHARMRKGSMPGPWKERDLTERQAAGYIVGKKIGLPGGRSISFHLTGPVIPGWPPS